MTREDDHPIKQTRRAYHDLTRAVLEICERIRSTHASATPPRPRPAGERTGSSSLVADPTHTAVADLEDHLISRGGPLFRVRNLIEDLDDLAERLGATRPARTLPAAVWSAGAGGARLHDLAKIAATIEREIPPTIESIFDEWRALWREQDDRHRQLLDSARIAWSDAATYATSIAVQLKPYEPERPVSPSRPCACPNDCGRWTRPGAGAVHPACRKAAERARRTA